MQFIKIECAFNCLSSVPLATAHEGVINSWSIPASKERSNCVLLIFGATGTVLHLSGEVLHLAGAVFLLTGAVFLLPQQAS